ncbi:MAG TPA: hypothetical protein GX744_01110 [Firmicutes bacterium]|jgi:flagellar basal-body rod modification protein FlgD|nr:hypothetical protein [Bacillota bacterium]
METGALSGTAATTASRVQETAVEQKAGLGSDLFLQLLVAQMRYQNPLSGEQDTGGMITQLALFSMLEQVVKVRQSLESQEYAAAQTAALNLLNRKVEVADSSGMPVSGPVTAVSFWAGQPLLMVEGQEYPYSALMRVEGGEST